MNALRPKTPQTMRRVTNAGPIKSAVAKSGMTTSGLKVARLRRTNAERTAQTQQDLLEATIDCLFRLGFGATTTHVVAEVAGLSRGAMVHHFRTKADMLVAAVRFAWQKEFAEMHARLENVKPGLPRFRALIDMHWAIVQQPEDIAINEVRNGSRSDAVLAEAVHPIMAEIASDYARFVGTLIREAKLKINDELRGLTVTWVLALPMMTFYRAADPNSRMEQELLSSLKHLQESLIKAQLGKR